MIQFFTYKNIATIILIIKIIYIIYDVLTCHNLKHDNSFTSIYESSLRVFPLSMFFNYILVIILLNPFADIGVRGEVRLVGILFCVMNLLWFKRESI